MAKAMIDDVARLANVSIKTVSRVVNQERNVRPETRARVLRAIVTLRCRPNPSARGLAGDRPNKALIEIPASIQLRESAAAADLEHERRQNAGQRSAALSPGNRSR